MPCINTDLVNSKNELKTAKQLINNYSKQLSFNQIKNTHLRHVTVHYFSRIVQPEAVFFPYWTSNTFFFRIVHYI
jgi:hypothetical protein